MAVIMTRGRRFAGRLEVLLAALLALCVWVAATALATRPEFKLLFDATPQAQFSVGPDTRAILDELGSKGATVRIDTFFEQLPSPQNEFESRVIAIQGRIQELTRDLLVRYAELGGATVSVTHFDVLRDVAASRTRIAELGSLRPEDALVVQVGKRHRALQLLDLAEIDAPALRATPVPGAKPVMPSLKLFKGEEAISSAIRSLLSEGMPKVYFLVGYDEAELERPAANSYSELLHALNNEGFRIERWNLELEGRIPDDAAVIALVEPHREISPQAAAVLWRWLRNGGRLFLNLAWTNVDGGGWNPSLEELGKLAGFAVGKDLVCHLVADPANPQSPGVGGPEAKVLVLPPNSPHPITRPLAERQRVPQMTLAREVLGRSSGQDTSFEPLLRTGPWGWFAPYDPRMQEADTSAPPDAQAYGVRTVAAVVDVRPEVGTRAGAIALFGGVAFLNQVFAQSGDLALNVFNWLARRDELVTVRGNRFVAQRLELSPQQLERSASLALTWTPLTILAVALFVLVWRRRA